MSYYDDASLVFIPSGYKTSKAYSIKPTSGDGDLAFTRSNDTATRVGPDGLIEKVRTNLIIQSQDFTTSWATNAAPTITANTTVAPDGTTTADTIASSGSSSGAYQVPTVASGVEYSFSVYVKNITNATTVQIGCDLSPSNGTISFNAVTGALIGGGAGITGSSVTDAGNGWYRVSGTYVSTGTTNTFIVFGQSGMTFAVWGAQLEAGVTTDYIATTAAAVSTGPTANTPRLDFLNSSCPRLLLEPQRTNLVTYSEQFDDTSWNKNACTISANASTSPDGYVGADKFIPNNAASGANVSKANFAASASTAYSFSIFVKAAGFTSVQIGLIGRSPAYNGGVFAEVNLTTGVITSTITDLTWTSATSKIDALNDGWYRVSVSGVSPSGTTGLTPAVISLTTGNGTDGVLVWGAQVEAGAYATSYIPTLAAAVTRGADAASKTGISSLIGSTAGTLFFEGTVNTNGEAADVFLLYNSSNISLGAYLVGFNTSGNITLYALPSASLSILKSGDNRNTRVKIALAYQSGDLVAYVNGVQTFSSAGISLAAGLSALFLNSNNTPANYGIGTYNQALLFKTRLTNAQLAELTA